MSKQDLNGLTRNNQQSIISFIRKGKRKGDYCIVVCNFSADVYHNYRIGVPSFGNYVEVFTSDSTHFGGSNQCNSQPISVQRCHTITKLTAWK